MSNIGTKFNIANRFLFDPNTNSLVDRENDDQLVRLGSNESRILLMLSERPNQVITRNELHDFVWREQGFEVDDSSLTQAISTLRKMLQDSTKSPQYVKTVPKRGYQLICPVEKTTPLLSGAEDDIEELDEERNESAMTEGQDGSLMMTEAKSDPVLEPKVETSPWLWKALTLVAILLPIFVIAFSKPAESNFREMDVVESVVIKTPISHPDLSRYLPSITQCIQRYNEEHEDGMRPKEVIVTGGQNNQLVLNYIHSFEYSSENVTLRIFAGSKQMPSVCKQDSKS